MPGSGVAELAYGKEGEAAMLGHRRCSLTPPEALVGSLIAQDFSEPVLSNRKRDVLAGTAREPGGTRARLCAAAWPTNRPRGIGHQGLLGMRIVRWSAF